MPAKTRKQKADDWANAPSFLADGRVSRMGVYEEKTGSGRLVKAYRHDGIEYRSCISCGRWFKVYPRKAKEQAFCPGGKCYQHWLYEQRPKFHAAPERPRKERPPAHEVAMPDELWEWVGVDRLYDGSRRRRKPLTHSEYIVDVLTRHMEKRNRQIDEAAF